MVKLTDFIKGIATKGAIVSPDLDTALAASAIKDLELPDDFTVEFDKKFLTADRAKNDPAIVAEIEKNSNRIAFKAFDEKLPGFYGSIAPEDVEAIKKEQGTYERYDLLRAAIKKAQASGKGKMNEDANKILEEKNAEIKALVDSHKAELKKQQEEMQKVTTDGILRSKILAKQFGKDFIGLRESIADLTVNNVRNRYTLSLDKGELKLLQPVPNSDTFVEAFENNEKLTIDKLLERELKQFIAVSNGKDESEKEKEKEKGRQLPDLKGATLAELRNMAAVQQ